METKDKKDSPGVIAPPPLIFLSGLISGGIVHWFFPVYIFPPLFVVKIAGALLIVGGLGIILDVHLKMKRARTNIEPWKPTTKIISDGIYAYSRNPVYVAMLLIYLGAVFVFNSFWFLPFLILVLLVMHYGVIIREESYLEGKFGEEYRQYKKRIRRWI
jgi:protein-S-isoprenylcysteine O-methyltransferase Ste14